MTHDRIMVKVKSQKWAWTFGGKVGQPMAGTGQPKYSEPRAELSGSRSADSCICSLQVAATGDTCII